MGICFPYPFAVYNDLASGFESVVVNSISLGDDDVKTPVQSFSFKGKVSEPTALQSKYSGQTMIEESVSFKTTKTETTVSVEAPSIGKKDMFITSSCTECSEMDFQSPRLQSMIDKITQLPTLDLSSPNHEAAIKLQKVYKSFRTRRKLADCAVLIEQSWWKLLDFAELKRSSISFFDIEKHETAISRWSRARTRAAKVGKGLSKNSRAQKLALQHWLEAIDPRHRYGHNLHFYYVKWLHSQSKEPFFYWLDIGEGKEVNLVDKCPRSKLQQQCIKYLGPMERKAYEVVIENGKLFYKQSGELIDATGGPNAEKWIFVLSTSMTLYVGQKRKGTFQHSSFLAGGATSAAGRIVVEKGILKAVWPHSGHYRPTPENFQDFLSFLRRNNVVLTDVKTDPVDEEESLSKQSSVVLRNVSSEEDLNEKDGFETELMDNEDKTSQKTNSIAEIATAAAASEPPQRRPSHNNLCKKLPNLSIPDRDDLFGKLKFENQAVQSSTNTSAMESPLDGYETAEESSASDQDHMVFKQDLSDDEEDEENKEEKIPQESILKRIDSHKGMNSYQLGKQLSCKWTTGAGPRIGCVRDYPSKLQFRALEKVNLSPRAAGHFRSNSTRECIPQSFSGEINIRKTSFSGELPRIRNYPPQVSPLCKGSSATGVTKQS
ncbi:IQ domain-containing protein IQM2 [Camellia lanceoleosa]|uniref:IQ domain-containing protein IQM2 n=1 Tax=Camellia lanceoleosa TaxID=1840588 RepID=A0ACC0FUW0_9ERIC|nr:IQ domain-containing protein IQM2 [Camellia lanceoleosa]